MERTIDYYLEKWVSVENRKPLLVRGSRQVGKTYAVRKLSEKFDTFIEINFDSDFKVKRFFEESITPSEIVRNLELYYDKKIVPHKTLLFFDEIQECKNAVRSLRYFYEKMPQLHLIAAGSLLEFTLSEIPSFGVGRVESIQMYPMSFMEFIRAVKNDEIIEVIRKASFLSPMNDVLHELLLKELKVFQIIGGMPEVVAQYLNRKDIKESQRTLNILIKGYETDFDKYRKQVPMTRLKETLLSIAQQSGAKFKYSTVGDESGTLYKDALNLLIRAGLAYVIPHTSASGIPLGATTNLRRFKVFLFDTGIYQRLMKLNLSEYIVADFKTIINRGVLAENLIANELIKSQSPYDTPELYYWHRNARNSLAEIDFIIEHEDIIIPVEVKAGLGRKMKSMHLFLQEKKLPFGIRFSSDNFSKNGKILSIPLYAVEALKTNINLLD